MCLSLVIARVEVPEHDAVVLCEHLLSLLRLGEVSSKRVDRILDSLASVNRRVVTDYLSTIVEALLSAETATQGTAVPESIARVLAVLASRCDSVGDTELLALFERLEETCQDDPLAAAMGLDAGGRVLEQRRRVASELAGEESAAS